jgi:hypothetical protein
MRISKVSFEQYRRPNNHARENMPFAMSDCARNWATCADTLALTDSGTDRHV